MRGIAYLAVTTFALLSACTVKMPDPIALSSPGGVSRNLVAPSRAFDIFDRVCLNTGPRFSGAIQTAATEGISTQSQGIGIDGIEKFVSATDQVALHLYRQRVDSKLQKCTIFFAANLDQKNEIFASFAERFGLERQGNQLNPNIQGYGMPYAEDYTIGVFNSRLPDGIFALKADSYHFLIEKEN